MGAWINAAIAALPSTGGEVNVAAGIYSFSNTVVIRKNIQLHGAGRNSSVLKYTGSGDAIEMEAGTSPPYMNGAIVGITLEGNANPNAVGIHHIDSIGTLYDDLTIENFSGMNGTGMWFENRAQFSERVNLRQVSMYRNKIGWRFSNANRDREKSNSFSYWRASAVHFQIAANQTGILAEAPGLIRGAIPSIFLLNGDLGIAANEEDETSTLIDLRNGAAFSGFHFDLFAECTACRAPGKGFHIDASSTLAGDGHIGLDNIANQVLGTYSLQPQSSESTGAGSLVFNRSPQLFGTKLTDTNLFKETSVQSAGVATEEKNFGSYPLTLEGSFWQQSAPQKDRWMVKDTLTEGLNPSSTLTLEHKGTSAAANVDVPGLVVQTLRGEKEVRCVEADAQGRVLSAASSCALSGSFVTSNNAKDAVHVDGMNLHGHCTLTPTNLAAAKNLTEVYILSKEMNQIVVAHPPSPGMTFDLLCVEN